MNTDLIAIFSSHVTVIAWSGANPGGTIRVPESEQRKKRKMKLREKTTAILLIAVFMISIFTVSVMAKKVKDYATIQDGTIQYGKVGDPNTEIIPIGYDQWGYNYQAHLFNGWYHNNLRPDVPYTDEQSLIDAGKSTTWLIMKWNDAWLSNKDRNLDNKLDRGNEDPYTSSAAPGAWVTNHQFGSYWDIEGEWVLEFDWSGTPYNHEMTITSGSDDIEGIGSYPAGKTPTITWTVTGSVTSIGGVELIIDYDDSTYETTAIGTILEDGTLSGTWTSNENQAGTWHSTEGSAIKYEWNYFVKIVYPSDDWHKDGDFWYDDDDVEMGSVIWGAFARTLQIYNDQGTGEHGVEYNPESATGLGCYK